MNDAAKCTEGDLHCEGEISWSEVCYLTIRTGRLFVLGIFC